MMPAVLLLGTVECIRRMKRESKKIGLCSMDE